MQLLLLEDTQLLITVDVFYRKDEYGFLDSWVTFLDGKNALETPPHLHEDLSARSAWSNKAVFDVTA